MSRSRRHRIRLIQYRSAVNGWVVRLQYWWLTSKKDNLLFFSLLALVPTVFFIAIWQSVEVQQELFAIQRVPAETQQSSREEHCLALNIYHEARGEPKAGQYAVAEVTMNRVASKRFPNTVCGVVYERRWDRIRKRYVGAFSWTELEPVSTADSKAWRQATEIAESVYNVRVKPKVDGALFYHARHIRPSWARKKIRVARIGRHVFYK